MAERERWLGRRTFIMAAIGSAIGLGNLWRFPYVAAKNGGGAFLVPYFVALLTAGIPVMIIEYYLGIRYQSSADVALGSIRRPFRVVGWVAILGAFIINVLYCVVLAWVCYYMIDSLWLTTWAGSVASAKNHFLHEVVCVSKGAWDVGGFQYPLLFGLGATWVAIWLIIRGGLGKIAKVLVFTVPLPVIMILILFVRGVTLPGAVDGLNYYLTPNWEALKNAEVWLAAYGQVFFSLSLGFGTMIVYASFMPRDTEVPNTAAITSFANCGFSFLAGFAVFSVLGYFAVGLTADPPPQAKAQAAVSATAAPARTDRPTEEARPATATEAVLTQSKVKPGPGLAFWAYPTALAKLPFAVEFFGVLFFGTLLLLGIDSAFSLLETAATGIADKFGLSRPQATGIIAVVSFLLGVPFVTGGGFLWLDITMHYTFDYLPAIIALVECVIIAHFFGIRRFTSEVNQTAEIKLGWVFTALVSVVTPVLLGVVIVKAAYDELFGGKPYGEGDYTTSQLLVFGVYVVAALIIAAVVLSMIRTKRDRELDEQPI